MNSEIRRVQNLREDELYEAAKQLKFRFICSAMYMTMDVSRLSISRQAAWPPRRMRL